MTCRLSLRGTMGLTHIVWQLVLFGIPFLFLAIISCKKYDMGLPGDGLTLYNYRQLFHTSLFFTALKNTFLLGITVAGISTVLGLLFVCVAWSFKSLWIRHLIVFTSFIVFFTGLIPRTFVVQYLLSEACPLNGACSSSTGLRIIPFQLYSFSGLVAAYTFMFVPVSIIVLFISRSEILEEYIQAAKDLGAPFFKIQLHYPIQRLELNIEEFENFILEKFNNDGKKNNVVWMPHII